ncbi:DUF4007 family protein [Streptomyces sp. NPDC001520]|uniref:DUF4007 family protein n=1 Tax=Streptomyces sp. NPDC001520 TaxID=3364581 RepID=UPI00367F204E
MPIPAFPPHVVPLHARHGSYSPRYGWLLKTYLALKENPHLFTSADAVVRLGVGKSMVASMRFWSAAFRLSNEVPDRPGAARDVLPTDRARWLLEDDGADPYLERDGSLWLLHWWLLSPPCMLPAWYYTFCMSPWTRLEPEQLLHGVRGAAVSSGWRPTSDGMIQRDIGCMLRMYTPVRPGREPQAVVENIFDRPFSALGLMSPDLEGAIRLSQQAGNSAPAAVLTYACLAYAARYQPDRPGQMVLSRLLHDDAGPGRVMRVEPRALRRALEATALTHRALGIIEDGSGQEVLTFSTPPLALAWEVLDGLYGDVRQRLGVRPEREEGAGPTATQPEAG